MQISFTSPDPILQPYVRRYFYIELDKAAAETPLDIHPVGYNTMAFTLDAGVFGDATGPYNFSLSYHGYIAKHIQLTPLVPRIKMVIVSFTATGATRLFGLSQHNLLNQIVALEEVIPGAQELKARLEGRVSCGQQAIRLIEQWLLAQLRTEAYYRHAPTIEKACALIQAHNGHFRIKSLCAELGISQTALEDQFKELIGTSPKLYCRITRFMAAYQFLLEQTHVEWSELVYRYRFFDQAHFIRDFKGFFGYSPSKIHLANAQLVRKIILD